MFLKCLKAAEEAYHAAEMFLCVPRSGESRWVTTYPSLVEGHNTIPL